MADETKKQDDTQATTPVSQPEKLAEKQAPTDMAAETKAAKQPTGEKQAPQGKRFSGGGRRPAGKAGDKPGDDKKGGDRRGRGGKPRGRRPEQEDREFDQQILELARVTRVTKGGKRMRFRVTMVIGDRKGRVGYGIAKGADVQTAVQKAVNQAKKKLITVPIVNGSIPHALEVKFSAAKVILKPAPKGTGIKAGGAVRTVLEFAGVPNITGKILGSGNKINNTKATMKALTLLTPVAQAPVNKANPKSSKAADKQPAADQAAKQAA
jgi:small subunit ribosomal protein S5